MKYFAVLFLTTISLVAQQGLRSPGFVGQLQRPAASGGLPSGDIVAETFDGSNSGFDLTSWTEDERAGCTVDQDYVTNPSPEGGDSLRLISVADAATCSRNITGVGEFWGRVLICRNDGANLFVILYPYNGGAGGSLRFQLHVDATGHLFVLDGQNNSNATSTDTMVTGTWYYIYFHWAKGSGANAVIEASFSATASGPSYASSKGARVTDGAVTDNIDHLRLGRSNSSSSGQVDDFNLFTYAQ